MTQVPLIFVLAVAAAAYFYFNRKREDEVLPDYARALRELAERRRHRDREGEAKELLESADAIDCIAGRGFFEAGPDSQRRLRSALIRATAPSLIDEANILHGTLRYSRAYPAIFRKMPKPSPT